MIDTQKSIVEDFCMSLFSKLKKNNLYITLLKYGNNKIDEGVTYDEVKQYFSEEYSKTIENNEFYKMFTGL